MLRTADSLASFRDFIAALRRSGFPWRRPPATEVAWPLLGRVILPLVDHGLLDALKLLSVLVSWGTLLGRGTPQHGRTARGSRTRLAANRTYAFTRSPVAADLSMAARTSWRRTASAKSGPVGVSLS